MSKPFSPIAAGFGHSPDMEGMYVHTASLNRRFDLVGNVRGWKVYVVDGNFVSGHTTNTFFIPASFDHAHVVALLRANGADIPEADHVD